MNKMIALAETLEARSTTRLCPISMSLNVAARDIENMGVM